MLQHSLVKGHVAALNWALHGMLPHCTVLKPGWPTAGVSWHLRSTAKELAVKATYFQCCRHVHVQDMVVFSSISSEICYSIMILSCADSYPFLPLLCCAGCVTLVHNMSYLGVSPGCICVQTLRVSIQAPRCRRAGPGMMASICHGGTFIGSAC